MRVLVTGARGLLGGVLARGLAGLDLHVTCTGRQSSAATDLPNYQPCELSDPHAVGALLSKARPNAIIHAAGRIQSRAELLGEFVRDNVLATANLVDFGGKSGVNVFVFVSTISVYSGDGPYTEDSPTNTSDPYGWSKRVAEQACLRLARHETRTIVLRCAGLHGHPRKDGVLHNLFQNARSGRPLLLTEPETRVTLTFLDEVVSTIAHILSLQEPPTGIFNIATAEATTYVELAQLIASVVGRDSDIESAAAALSRNRVLLTDRLQRDLGIKPTSLVHHLHKYSQFLR